MALPVRQQIIYWSLAALVFFLALWFLGDVILPFLVGGAIAYFLDPVADRLEASGLSRTLATTVIAIVALVIFTILALLVIPTLISQTIALGEEIPAIFNELNAYLSQRFPVLEDPDSTIRQSLSALGQSIQDNAGELVQQIFASALGVIGVVVFIVVVPVVAFYLLLDWDNMIERIDELLPRDHQITIRRLASEVDKVMAGFVRGQLTVCMILGTFYSIALMAVGLKFGLVVGAVAGLLTFIPYVGSLVGGVLSIGLAVFQFWGDPGWIVAVALIFILGQMIEGNYLTPKLVGGSVGLHPVWLLFALSAFGTVFGFVGMLVAVPVSAMIGVLVRFAIAHYTDGRLYKGLMAQDTRPEE
ncbi:AI-2E family transporter [Tropicimonas sp. S265A]|uniref:AI-2E family transporter n=1 Tax=Tropicimonas sp. S265A TaxID=3415134 RepID=UPI003C7B8910